MTDVREGKLDELTLDEHNANDLTHWFVRYCVICGKKFKTLRPDAILCAVWGNSPCSWTQSYDTHDEDGELLYPDE